MQELRAELRNQVGKKVRALREAAFLPAVVYGEGIPTQAITVSCRDFEKVYQETGESAVLELDVAGNLYSVLIHDIAHDPLRGNVIHADFYAVRMDKVLRVKVPVVFTGESRAIKNEGGILVRVLQEIEVEALPQNLPHEFYANLEDLEVMNSRILVKDLPHEDTVKIIAEPDEVIALIEAPRSDEALAELRSAPVLETKEVETERETKVKEKTKDAPVAEAAE